MDADSADISSQPPEKTYNVEPPGPAVARHEGSAHDSPTAKPAASGISSWARNLKIPQSLVALQDDSKTASAGSTFSRFTGGIGLRFPPAKPASDAELTSTVAETGVLQSLGKNLVNSSRNAVKAVQVKARHIVSQNKQRYQEGGFDLDLTYITENIIAMGFPAGDTSSGLLGYVEGFYRNHMEEVIKFFETRHKGKYKVYNLCSERLYNPSLFEGEVASFPFEDHNCPPIQLIASFCQNANSWLKEDDKNVVVIHCKAGTERTGLMVSSLLLFLKVCPTAEECIDFYNQKRYLDGKGQLLPSQIRYVKYFGLTLAAFSGEVPPGRRCMFRGIRLQRCPYWIRPSITIYDHRGILFSTRQHPKTKNLTPEDFWFKTQRKGTVVFALPKASYLTGLAGDFKVHFHDLHGEFYCWLNTTMSENKIFLSDTELDGFEKRKLPCPGFQVEIVLVDDDSPESKDKTASVNKTHLKKSSTSTVSRDGIVAAASTQSQAAGSEDKDGIFSLSDSEDEETASQSNQMAALPQQSGSAPGHPTTKAKGAEQASLKNEGPARSHYSYTDRSAEAVTCASSLENLKLDSVTDIKAMAADASVFSFGDEDDFESD